MFAKARERLAKMVAPTTLLKDDRSIINVRHLQAHPAQKTDAQTLYAPSPNLIPFMVQYALNNWVYTGVNKIATVAASAEFMITSRPDGMTRNHHHGLLSLLGKYGKPNDDQDSFEFFEKHFQYLTIAGNVFWLWKSRNGGSPDEVHLLEPEQMRIRPGRDKTVAYYEYWHNGSTQRFSTEQITHFRRSNPFNRYYGLSALQILYLTVVTDNSMVEWNNDFFDDELGLPSGIMVVPQDTSDPELNRIRDEFVARHGEGRRVAFIKADAGKSIWLDSGLKHKDYDFTNGRILNRQSVYEALDIPLGVMSENSTEAHALVAERQLTKSVQTRHIRTTRKLNIDGLNFWPAENRWQTEFEDIVRNATDWRREKDRIFAESTLLSLDEMRMREYKLPPLPDGTTTLSGGQNESRNVSTEESDSGTSGREHEIENREQRFESDGEKSKGEAESG